MNNKFYKESLFRWGVCLIATMFVFACQENNAQYTVGDDFVYDDANVIYVDTVKVYSSTMIMDSVITSGSGRLLTGSETDPYLGTTSVISQMHFSYQGGSATEIDRASNADSIYIELTYDGYYEGDTTQLQTIEVYELADYLEPKDLYGVDGDVFYNTTPIRYIGEDDKSKMLGEINFHPRPTNNTKEYIRLSDEFRDRLFNYIIETNEPTNESYFLNSELAGLVFTPGDTPNGQYVGFSTQDNYSEMPSDGESSEPTVENVVPRLIIHYKDENGDFQELIFNMTLEPYQYNYYKTDRTGAMLEELEPRVPISTSETEERMHIQAGTGVYGMIDFSRMDMFHHFGLGTIASAQLAIRPTEGTYEYDGSALPEQLGVYILDRQYDIESQLTDLSGTSLVYANLYRDYDDEDNTEYTIDVTNFVREEFNGQDELKKTLQLRFINTETMQSIEKFSFDSQEGRRIMELRVIYVIAE